MIMINKNEPTVGRKTNKDQFSQILMEASEFFNESGINMIRGFDEIVGDDVTFGEYKAKLTESMDADDAMQFEQLMDNQRLTVLRESTSAGIAPIAGLSMPTVRKMWARTALKNAIPTETAKLPTFAISYLLPYLRDNDGTKHYLPDAVRAYDNTLNEKTRLHADWIEESLEEIDLLTLSEASVENCDTVDKVFFIEAVKLQDSTEAHEGEVVVNLKADLRGNIMGVTPTVMVNGEPIQEKILGNIDFETGKLTVVGVKGALKAVKVKGWLSSENNTRTQSAGFETRQKEVVIGTGSHLNAELPIEFIQDNLALYNIDSTVEVVDIMSKVTAHKLDQRLRQFLDQSFETSGTPFIGEFDVKPAAGFAGTPTQWRPELRTVVDYWASKIKQSTAFSQGYFVIVGNRIDINLLPDVNWQFRSISAQKAGVTVDYDLGVTTYNNAFQIVACDVYPQGELTMFFVPSDNNQMTYKYYPYSFNIQKDYRSEQMSNVPSIMMTKRDTVEELIPAIAKIRILNNDGSLISTYSL